MKFSVKKTFSVVTLLAMVVSSSMVLSADATTTKTTRYAKWTFADNGSYTMSDYTLSLDLYSGMQTRVICPDGITDDRYRSANTGIVQLMNGDNTCGTGFIVGDHTIATAAHCVYRDDGGGVYLISDPSIITYTDDGTRETTAGGAYNQIDVTEIHIPYEYYSGSQPPNNGENLSHVDYALLTVEADLSEYTHFELGIPYNMNTVEFREIDLYTSGIPRRIGTNLNNTAVYTALGHEDLYNTSNQNLLYYTCDTENGQSGSPIYTATQYYYPGMDNPVPIYTAIAIVHGGDFDWYIDGTKFYYNWGACIDSSELQFYYNNTYAST